MMEFPANYYKRILKVLPAKLFGFWRMDELGPSLVAGDWSIQSNNAAFSARTMMSQGRGPDGKRCPLFGSGLYLNLYSAGLAADCAMAEVSGMIWAKGTAAVMSGTTAANILTLSTDANNLLTITKNTTAYQVAFDYKANSTAEQTTKTFDSSDAGEWHCYGFSVSDTDDYAKFYVDGVLEGTDTGIGTWSGALAEALCVVGASSTTVADEFAGNIALLALWSTPISNADHKYLGTLRGK